MIQLIFVLVSAICRDILRIKYTVFTKVGLYVKWIKFVLNSIHDAYAQPRVDYEPILWTKIAFRFPAGILDSFSYLFRI